MNKILSAIAILATTITAWACSSDEPGTDPGNTPAAPHVTVSVSKIEAPATGGQYTVKVTNESGGWEAYATDLCRDWVTVSVPDWASKGADVNVVVKANNTTEARSGEVVVKAGTSITKVAVEQSAPMQIDKTQVYSQSIGGTFTINVVGATAWTASATEPWIKPNKVSGERLDIEVGTNDTDKDRLGTVEIVNGSELLKVQVKQSSNIDREINIPEGYAMVWNDEFNVDGEPSAEWWYETGAGGWGNNEIQNYVKCYAPGGQQLATVKDGILTITCAKIGTSVYSIRMNTQKSWTYGWFEARLKLPKGKGTWPAYWMMPKNFKSWPADGEIDIMEEVGYHANYVSSSIHCTAYNHTKGTQKTREIHLPGAQDEFHVYALEWTPDYIRTYVDGKELFYFANDGKGNYDTWPFFNPFYLKLNLAWGGNWGGAQGIDESCLPAEYEIDYVRVFQKP